MANEKFIALEETSQEIKTTVNDVKTNVDGLKNTDVPGIDETVNATYEKTLELERKLGGTGGAFFIYSDMSVKNEQSPTSLCTFNGYSSDYSYSGFIVNEDIYILGYRVKSVIDIRVYKITDYATKPISTLIVSNSEFPGNSSYSTCGVCSNLKDKFYLLTSKAALIKIDVINKTVTALKTDLPMYSYPLALAVSEDEAYCAHVSYNGSGNTDFRIYDLINGSEVKKELVNGSDRQRSIVWFEGPVVNANYNKSSPTIYKYGLDGTLLGTKETNIPSGYFPNIQSEYIYYRIISSSTAKEVVVYNKITGEQYGLSQIMSSSANNMAFLGERNGKIIYLSGGNIYPANAYAPGEICLYLKAGNKVYTDGYVRDIDFVNAPNVDEVVTIPKDSKYLIHNYSYITVG